MKELKIKHSIQAKIIYLIVFAGSLLSIIQFIYNRSLWLDESLLALNIIHKSPLGLLKPLDYNQLAPILFLQVQHFFSILLPGTEYGLRIFPLLCYLGSIFFFYKLLKIIFKDPFLILFALAVYIFNQTTIYYSSEAKQYIIDVFVTTLLYYILLKHHNNDKTKYLQLAGLGYVSIFLSNISVLLLCSISIYLLYDYFYAQRKNFKYVAIVIASWGITFIIYYLLFIYNHPTKNYMLNYWSRADAFMPFNHHFPAWIISRFNSIFTQQFHFGQAIGIFLIILFFAGMAFLIIHKKLPGLILLFLPIVMHILLSGIKMYPFETRLELYTTPLLIIIFSWGLFYIYQLFNKYINNIMMLVVSIIFSMLLIRVIAIHPFPFIQHDEIRGCISYMKKKTPANDDNIYAARSASGPLRYYHDINFFETAKPIIYGLYYWGGPGESAPNINELKNLKGPVWIFYLPGLHDEDMIVHFLDSAGYKRVDTFTTSGDAFVALYDPKTINISLKQGRKARP